MKEHGNFSHRIEYERIPDVPDDVSARFSGDPSFYNQDVQNVFYMESDNGLKIPQKAEGFAHRQGERVDNRVSFEQAWAEAHAAKPFMDIAVEARDLFSEEEGPDWIDKVDGINEVITLGKRASDEVSTNWAEMSEQERQGFKIDGSGNLKLTPYEKELVEYVKSNNATVKMMEKAQVANGGENPGNEAHEWDSILSGLEDKLKTATGHEKDDIEAKIASVNRFTNRINLDAVRTHANDDFWHEAPRGVAGPASEMMRNQYRDSSHEFNLARAAVYEQTLDNKTAVDALSLFAEYKSSQSKPSSSEFAASKAKENEIRRAVKDELESDPMTLDAAAREAIRVASDKRNELEAQGNIKELKKLDSDIRASRAIREVMSEYRRELDAREEAGLVAEKFEDFVNRKREEYEEKFFDEKTEANSRRADKFAQASHAFRGTFAATLRLKYIRPAITKSLQKAGVGQ